MCILIAAEQTEAMVWPQWLDDIHSVWVQWDVLRRIGAATQNVTLTSYESGVLLLLPLASLSVPIKTVSGFVCVLSSQQTSVLFIISAPMSVYMYHCVWSVSANLQPSLQIKKKLMLLFFYFFWPRRQNSWWQSWSVWWSVQSEIFPQLLFGRINAAFRHSCSPQDELFLALIVPWLSFDAIIKK